jgi:hypothetical protein
MQIIKKYCIPNAKNKKDLHCQCRKIKKNCIANAKNEEKLAFPIAKNKNKLHSNKVEIIQATFLK